MTWIYRLQRRLAITRHEGLAVLTLAGLFVLGLAVNQQSRPEVHPDPETYATVQARFEARAHATALPGANRPAAAPEQPPADEAPAPPPSAQVQLDLNRASPAALEQLPGIGPTLSQRIAAFRRDHGAFTTVDDIVRVHGIGEKTLARLRPLLTVAAPPTRAAARAEAPGGPS